MQPILTVITINRNNAQGLRATIQSVLAQKCFPKEKLEYIIIDGASTDGSVDVIKEFADSPEYGRFITKWISEPDSGIYNAMNKGLRLATGELIGMLNSGDTYLPYGLFRLEELHAENPGAVLYGAEINSENGHFDFVTGINAERIPQQMLGHESCFVPKAVYEQFGEYDESFKIVADHDLFLTFYQNNVPFVFTETLVHNYDLGGISTNNTAVVAKERIRLRKKHGLYKKPSVPVKIRRLIKKYIFGILVKEFRGIIIDE